MANEKYGVLPGPVIEMLKRAGRATFDLREDDDADWSNVYIQHMHIEDARVTLESLGVPLEVLAALKAGTWQAVPKHLTGEMKSAAETAWMNRRLDDHASDPIADSYAAALAAAPTSPTGES